MKIGRLLFLTSILFTLPGALAVHADRLALLVQIADYEDAPLFQDGKEAQMDVPLMQKALGKRHCFDTTQLVGAQATHEGVLKALDDLVARAHPGDAVVFYFSGLGARVGDQFSICPWDALRDSSIKDITEGDLRERLVKLKAESITVILDCCFTSIPLSNSTRAKPKSMAREAGAWAPEGWPVRFPTDRAVLITAASPNEVAMQGRSVDGQWMGAFTHFLASRLEAANPETTYRQLASQVQLAMNHWQASESLCRGHVQTPRLVGADRLLDRPLFATSPGAQPALSPDEQAATRAKASVIPQYVIIDSVGRKGKVTLDRGADAGITVGARYSVFPAGEESFTDKERQLGEIEVTDVTADVATAVPVEGTIAGKITPDCRAVFRAHDVTVGSEVAIRVDGKGEVAQRIRDALADLRDAEGRPLVRLVGDSQPDKPCASTQMELRIKENGRDVSVYTLSSEGEVPLMDALTLPDRNPAGAGSGTTAVAKTVVARLVSRIDRLSVLRALANLENPSPGLDIELSTDRERYSMGDRMQVRARVSKTCCLVLIHVDAAGNPTLLFPRDGSSGTRVEPGQEYVFPPPGVIYEVAPPVGRDSLIALGLRDEAHARDVVLRLKAVLDPRAEGTPLDTTWFTPPGARLAGGRGKGMTVPSKGVDVKQELNRVQSGPPEAWALRILHVQTVP